MRSRCSTAARDHGIEAVLTRADHPSGTDRLAEVAAHYGWSDDTIVVNVQGDEPLIDPALVRGVASHLAASAGCAIATAAHPIAEPADVFNPNVVKVVLDARGVALYFSRAPIPWARDAYQPHWPDIASMPAPPASATVYRHIGLYAYRAKFLRTYPSLTLSPIEQAEALEQLRAMWHGERIAVLVTRDAPLPGVDNPRGSGPRAGAFRVVGVKTHGIIGRLREPPGKAVREASPPLARFSLRLTCSAVRSDVLRDALSFEAQPVRLRR